MKVWVLSYYDIDWKAPGTHSVYLNKEKAEEEFRRLKNDPVWRYCCFHKPTEHEVME